MKLLFYSHNVFGLGHVVRSARLAQAAVDGGLQATLATGCPAIDSLALDPRIQLYRLPSLRFEAGRFSATDPNRAGDDILAQRAELLLAHLRGHRPDAVVVDHLPLGLGGELRSALLAAQREGWATRFIWGIPYSEGALPNARQPGNPTIRRSYAQYHAALAYGRPEYDDVFSRLPSWVLPQRRHYVGFIGQCLAASRPPTVPRIVGLVGGGFGAPEFFAGLLASFCSLRSKRTLKLRLVVGPLGAATKVREQVGDDPDIEVWPTADLPTALAEASVVVSRAGYNSAFSLVQGSLPVIFVPQRLAADDQPGRAARLAELPAVSTLDETHPEFTDKLSSQLLADLQRGPVHRSLPFSVDGARETVSTIESILRGRSALAPQPSSNERSCTQYST